MRETGKAAIARFVLRTKQYLAVVRPYGDALAVSTLVYHDEVVPASRLDGLPGEDVEVSDKELAMARQLVESLSTDWQPERYEDSYRQRVLELIEAKAAGQEVVTVPDAERESGDVVDLMAALEASLAAAGDRAGGDGDAEAEAS
jgi:DNA end-binding protein Ku